MKPFDLIKTNQLYFWVSLYFLVGSLGLSMIDLSMNMYILLNGLLLVGVPALFVAYRYKGEKGFKEFVRLNPVSFKTILYSVMILISVYPIIMLSNALMMIILPEIPTELNNQKSFVAIAVGFQIIGLGLFPGFFEELLFRGVLLRGVENRNKQFAIIYIAFLFSLLHLNPYNFMGPFILGIVFGYMVYATNSIIPSMIAHMTNNLMAVGLLFVSTKLQTLLPEEESLSAESIDVSMTDIPMASIILSGFMLLGLAYGSFRLTRFLLRKLKEENEQKVKENRGIENVKEPVVFTKKERRSFFYIFPMVAIFICILCYAVMT
ncbi:CPBP family intramembrane glutamic endopeptidase [Bacillus sp. M6-12]|uniref:CPBP family intramembrane glutamic endopeptidase n=1 Tax=Bacillus sp. M6-12 TaxID=2054166 RepID=UPI0015E10D93|nr:type II CAAX endopeptidase family protein [Bacillus sp. M6-12]